MGRRGPPYRAPRRQGELGGGRRPCPQGAAAPARPWRPPRRAARWAQILVGVGVILGCQDSSSLGGSESTSDSAAVPAFVLDTIQRIEDDVLWGVTRTKLDERGRVFAVVRPGHVVGFGPQGSLEGAIGSQGQGPGEFGTKPRDLVVEGDSVYVLDPRLRRVTRFVARAFDESWSFRELPGVGERLWVGEDRAVVVSAMPTTLSAELDPLPPGQFRFYRRPVRVFKAPAAETGEWEELFEFQGPEQQLQYVEGGMVGSGRPPFWAETLYEFTEVGMIAADRRSGEVWLRSWEGSEVTIREPPEPSYVADWELELYDSIFAEDAARRDQTQWERELYRLRDRAALDRWEGRIPRPVYSDLVTDGRFIALERYEMRNDVPKEWLVLDLDGTEVGTLTLPPNLRLWAMRWPVLAAVASEEFDVEAILLLQVREERTVLDEP